MVDRLNTEENMRKKILITVMVILAITITSAIALEINSNMAKEKAHSTGVTYEQAMQDTKPFVAMFSSEWCGYCTRFLPIFKQYQKEYKGRYNFVIIDAEDSMYSAVVQDYAISGLPMVYIIDPTIDNRVLLNNAIYGYPDKFRAELDRYLRIRAMIKQ